MDYHAVKEYIESLSLKQIESMKKVVSSVALKKYIRVYIAIDKARLEAPIWLYIGVRRDHIIVPRLYCSCKHFIIRVMSEKRYLGCIHLLGQRLAEETGKYREVTADRNTLAVIVDEVLEYGRSRTLRKILYSR